MSVSPETSAPRPGPRAVIDEEMQAELARALEVKDLTKEAAVKHARHWVRLTRLCNQRCIFCLDSWNHNGTYVDTQQLMQYIDLGKALGRERLILSGGEPTIHPDYVKLLKHGKKAGYDWIQTVTNGMMFAYPEFARRCIQAGLNEVTISIHGHTPKLQDRLVGVPGAFDKAIEGIKNIQALSGGRTVVNIDVVINKQNVPHLREIIDLFRGMGIHEFDLLYIVPFGRGFSEYRSQLYFDLGEHYDDLQRAFEVSKEPGVYIWTNRLPVEYLEGYEHLIQDPHKLHSEVQGGLHNFQGYLEMGTPPDCHGERCSHCFLKGLCHDQMFEYRQRLEARAFDRVRVDLDVPVPSTRAAIALDTQRPRVVHVQGADAAAIREWIQGHPYRDEAYAPELVVEPRDEATSAELMDDAGLARVVANTPAALERLLAAAPEGPGPAVEARLTAETARWLQDNEPLARPWIEADRLLGHLPNFEYVSGVRDNGVGGDTLRALAAMGLRLMNVAPCIGGAKAEPGAHHALSRDMLDDKGRLSVTPYVQRYIEGEYYKKSLRCRGCALTETCRGMHINFLRAHGFAQLQPVG